MTPVLKNHLRVSVELFLLQDTGSTMNRLTLAILAAVSSFSSFAMEKPYVGIDYQQASFDI